MGLGALQPMHLILIVAIIVIVFGPSKLPELGSSLGKGIREFKRSSDDFKDIRRSRWTSSVSLEPTRRAGRHSRCAAAETKPEPRHEPVVLSRQEIDG